MLLRSTSAHSTCTFSASLSSLSFVFKAKWVCACHKPFVKLWHVVLKTGSVSVVWFLMCNRRILSVFPCASKRLLASFCYGKQYYLVHFQRAHKVVFALQGKTVESSPAEQNLLCLTYILLQVHHELLHHQRFTTNCLMIIRSSYDIDIR